VARVTEAIAIRPAERDELEALLPLIADYQRFYEVTDIDPERNRAFFARFIAPSDDGLLLGAWSARELRGFACLYWSLDSLVASETVQMHDLYVIPAARGSGVGRALLDASAAVARERGVGLLQWTTAPDNSRARRLYDATGASTWDAVEYVLKL
jgi:GNAT superfamily N-acetyltransferase